MLKLHRYLRPYIFILILAICLLFVQAIGNLKLPSLMSDIVNVGIQSSGIENATPKAISENGINFLKVFMSEDDIKIVDENYELIQKGNSEYVEDYPGIMDNNIYILKDVSDDDLSKLDRVFEVSTRTFIDVMSELNSKNNNSVEITDNTQIDFSKIYGMQPYLESIDESIINEARQKAESMDESLLEQSAIVFTKLFYQEIDVDISKIQTNYILWVGLKMIGVTLLVIVSAVCVNFISTRTATRIARNIRKDVFKKVQTFSDAEFDKFSTSSLITRTTNDITQIQNIIISGIRIMAYAPVMGIGAIIMILNTNTSMTWILVLACVLILILIATIFALAMPKFKKLQELIDNINLVSRENLEGVMVSRAFRTQRYEEKRFDNVNKKLTKTNLFVNRVMVFMMPAMTLIMNGITLLIVWIGAHQIAESALMVGDMMAFMQYAMQVIMSFLMISMIFIMVPRASVSANRINEVLETEPVIKNPTEPKKSNDKNKGIVEFKNVNFKYTGADEYALENITFTAEKGKTTAFIGSTGSR